MALPLPSWALLICGEKLTVVLLICGEKLTVVRVASDMCGQAALQLDHTPASRSALWRESSCVVGDPFVFQSKATFG